jgi:hypothetical protein
MTYHPRHDEETQCHDSQALAPRQAHSDDPSSELPRSGIEGIGDPVRNEAGHTPFPTVWRNGIEVFVCPARVAGGEAGGGLIDTEMWVGEAWDLHLEDLMRVMRSIARW